MYGKVQESGISEIIPFICISAILGQYPVFFFHILSFLGAHPREWLVWESNGYQIAGILLLLDCPECSGAHIGRLQSLMTVTSLFADMAGSSPFLNPFWEILAIWSVVDGECEDSACPQRSLKRITVGPEICISLEACPLGQSFVLCCA